MESLSNFLLAHCLIFSIYVAKLWSLNLLIADGISLQNPFIYCSIIIDIRTSQFVVEKVLKSISTWEQQPRNN